MSKKLFTKQTVLSAVSTSAATPTTSLSSLLDLHPPQFQCIDYKKPPFRDASKMHDFILNIDNKEILIEILHYAIDRLMESASNPADQSQSSGSNTSTATSTNNTTTTSASIASSSGGGGSSTAITSSTGPSSSSAAAVGPLAHHHHHHHHKFGFAGADEFDVAVRHIGHLCRRHALRDLEDADLLRLHFAHLPADLQQSVLDVLCTRRAELLGHLMSEFNARDRALVRAIDWDVRWVLGSSSLAALREQLATMVWQCRQPASAGSVAADGRGDDGSDGTISFEMSRQQVRDMIGQLEECARRMDEGERLPQSSA